MHEHRETMKKERRAWQYERDAQQEELVHLRGVVASKVKLNPHNPKDSLETSMKKVRELQGMHGALVMHFIYGCDCLGC